MARSRTEGLARLKRLAQRLPPEAKAAIGDANRKSADEFMGLVRRIIPKGEPAPPDLVDTLRKAEGGGEVGTAVEVSIGGPEAPYPLHLEAGHRAADGTHVAGRPFWNDARYVTNKRHKGRASRAQRKAIKSVTGGGNG